MSKRNEPTTSAQKAKSDELLARGVDKTYMKNVRGRGVISVFERYVKTADPLKINPALYHFLSAYYTIAHYDIHGFRSVYTEPVRLMDEVLRNDPYFSNGRGQYVYTDGMASEDIHNEIKALCVKHYDAAEKAAQRRLADSELACAGALAAKHGLRLVPA